MAKKKVVLFLVEGITDQIALGLILSKLVENEKVHFEIAEGDITTQNGITTKNAKEKVWNHIKTFFNKMHYKKQNLKQIIHIIDTDGAFVPASAIVPSDTGKTYYSLDLIYAKDQEAIINRNKMKREIVDCLRSTSIIGGVSYQMYYFSRNLEHALHNQIDELTSREKQQLAEKLEDDYFDHPELFIELLTCDEILVPGNYRKSWESIEDGLNALKRGSNFALFFKTNQN